MSGPPKTGRFAPKCIPVTAEKSISALLSWSKSSALLKSTPTPQSQYVESNEARRKLAGRSVISGPPSKQQLNFHNPSLLSSRNLADRHSSSQIVFHIPPSVQRQMTKKAKKPVTSIQKSKQKNQREKNQPLPAPRSSVKKNLARLSNLGTSESDLEIKEEDNITNDQLFDHFASIVNFNAETDDTSGRNKNQSVATPQCSLSVYDNGNTTTEVALLDQWTICDYLLKEEEDSHGRSDLGGLQSPRTESQSSSLKPKIRISTSIFETPSQVPSWDEDSDDFEIKMDHETSDSDSSENEDNLEYSVSLQNYLQSTELSSAKKTALSVARKVTKEATEDKVGRDGTDSYSESSDSTTSTSEDSESDDNSSIFSPGETVTRSKSPKLSAQDSTGPSNASTNLVVQDCNINEVVALTDTISGENPLRREAESESGDNGSQSFTTTPCNGNTIKFDPDQNEDEDPIELISLDGDEDYLRPSSIIIPIKTETRAVDGSTNKRTGAKKIRFRPARPRNYAYRKRDWRCPSCHKTMKYGSRFLHLQLKHNQPYRCPHCPFKSKKRLMLRKHILAMHRDSNGRYSTKFQCDSCHKKFCFQETLDRHKKTVHSKKLFSLKCVACVKVFRSTIELGRHIKTDHPGDKPFQCQKCDKAYKTSSALKIHILGKHENSKPYVCDKCGLGFTRRDKMEHHKNLHFKKENNMKDHAPNCTVKCPHIKPTLTGTSELYICKLCGHVCEFCSYIFQSNRLFTAHTHHNFCALCVLKFPNEKAYKLHVAYHEPEDLIGYRCELCKFGFTDLKFLNIHGTKMHRQKLLDYNCLICSKTFNKPQYLKAHTRRVHEKKRAHKCPWCKESFITITLLHFHLHRKHTLEKHYQCKTCKKEFVRQAELNRHVKSHTEERLFECSICDLKLKSNRNLRLHSRIHEQRKLYLCDICGVKVTQKCYLKLHKKLHEEGGKPFPCLFCYKSYLKPEGLKDHVIGVHGFKDPYSCDKCHKYFGTKQGLAKHCRNSSCGIRMGTMGSARVGTKKMKSITQVSSSSESESEGELEGELDSKSMSGGSSSSEDESNPLLLLQRQANVSDRTLA